MGHKLSISIEDKWDPRISPRCDRPATFDPLYGWPKGRKPREMVATWEEMEQYALPLHHRDYCAHKLIAYKICMRDRAPVAGYYCSDLRHAWDQCEYEDHLVRMKEYEREKRLLKRKVRKEAAANAQ